MKLQQVRAFCAVVDENLSISRAADVLCMTQPAVSKQIRLLEDSLGATLLMRSRTRILGLTDVGHDVLRSARSLIATSRDMAQIVADHQHRLTGRLSLATTHTHARYALHDIIPDFIARHASIALHMVQAAPGEITDLVLNGQVDLGISTMPRTPSASVAALPCYRLKHILIGKKDHPVFSRRRLTLEAIAAYPLIIYSDDHAIGRHLNNAFQAEGLTPKVAVRGADVEVMKYYASRGLGLAVIPLIAYSGSVDTALAARPVDHLFDTSAVFIMTRRGAYWPGHLHDFVTQLAPSLTRARVQALLRDDSVG